MRAIRNFLSVACFAALPAVAGAQDYQLEVEAGYVTDTESDIDAINVGGTFHWRQVSTAGSPLAEAAFLDRVGGVSVDYLRIDTDFGDFDAWSLEADHYFDSGLYLAARGTFPDEGDDTWGASVGFVATEGLLLVLDADDNGDDIDYTGRAKYVGKLAGDTAWGLDVAIADEVYGVGANYFFSAAFLIGADITLYDEADATTLGLEAKYFFTPRFWGSANYNTDVAGDADLSTWGIAAGLRF
ncbi:putative porin [Simiduia sp. 21SJ11W-1]|uniref:putative porin n=1 Tax=Simiduia sp. 21SJ11W-1 TaxID=2909669 RepID=UPI00209F6FB0|nr:putative porin [Simiduia sp. 21SJ11W-1]UTA48912.1 putative porin [Simiduia sp. 21SJ11W-1]